MVAAPTRARAPMTTLGKTTEPGSSRAEGATTAEGWTRVARRRPSATRRSTRPRRATAPMAGMIGRSGSGAGVVAVRDDASPDAGRRHTLRARQHHLVEAGRRPPQLAQVLHAHALGGGAAAP